MKPATFFTGTFIIYSLLLFGCKNGAAPLPAATPALSEPAAPPTADPTLTPAKTALQLSIDQLVIQPDPDHTLILGMVTNQDQRPVTGVRIRVRVLDQAGWVISADTSLFMENLAPGESSPFQIAFDNVDEPVSASASVSHLEAATISRVDLEVAETDRRTGTEGDTWVLAQINNPSSTSACLNSLTAASFSPEGEITVITREAAGLHSISPAAEQQYFFHLQHTDPQAEIRIFADGQPCDPDLAEPGIYASAEILYDEQGNPFLLGSLTSSGSVPVWTEAVLTIRQKDRILTMFELSPPFPLTPGESITFTRISFPALLLDDLQQAHQSADIDVTLQPDPARSHPAASPVLIPVFITGMETTGSRLILSGEIQNNREQPLLQPSVQVRFTTTSGEWITGGWTTAADAAEPGEAYPFQLILPLPAGTDMRFSEHDLRAFGIMGSEDAR